MSYPGDWKSVHPLETGPQMFERGRVCVSIAYGGKEVEIGVDVVGYGSVVEFIPREIIDELFEAWTKQQAKERAEKP